MFRIPTLITALSLLPLTGRAGENVPVDQLPDAVVNAIHVEYPGAKLLKAEVEKEEEVTFYEVHVVHQDIKMEIDVSLDGKVLAVDEDLRKQN